MSNIDVSKCPHLTGVVHCGFEECDIGKACDLDCEWYQLQQLKQENEHLKLINLNMPDFIKYGEEKGWGEIVDRKIFENAQLFGKLQQAERKLKKIKVIAQDIIQNDCYENSDVKAETILQIIKGIEE